ncbi:unnamed protein product, partial [Meganyctiphanes norvegica]
MEPQKICEIDDDTQDEEPKQTYSSEMIWKVHYANHERRNQSRHHNNHASLETSLEDFGSDEDDGEQDEDDRNCDESEGETDYATDYGRDGDDEGDGGDGYETAFNQDTATEIASDSDESGCETEVSFKASTVELNKIVKDIDKEDEIEKVKVNHFEKMERIDNVGTRENNYSEAQIVKKVNRKESQVLILLETETDDEDSDVGETDVCGFSDSDSSECDSDNEEIEDAVTLVEHPYKINREENISRTSTEGSQLDEAKGARPRSRLSSSGDSLSNKSQLQNGNSEFKVEKQFQPSGNSELTVEKQSNTVEIEEKCKNKTNLTPSKRPFRKSIEEYSRPQMSRSTTITSKEKVTLSQSQKSLKVTTTSNKVKTTQEEPPGKEIVQKRELPHTPPDLVMMKSRIQNLRRIINTKNDEIKELKNMLKLDKEQAITEALKTQKDKQSLQRSNITINRSIELGNLRRERATLRKEKDNLRAELRKTSSTERHKATELRRAQLEKEKKLKLAAQAERREKVRESKALQEISKTLSYKEK